MGRRAPSSRRRFRRIPALRVTTTSRCLLWLQVRASLRRECRRSSYRQSWVHRERARPFARRGSDANGRQFFLKHRLELFELVVGQCWIDPGDLASVRFNPKFWCSRLRRLRARRAAADSNTRDIATCAITSDFCVHERLPPTERFAPRNASIGSAWEVSHAGTIPKAIPVSRDIAMVKSKTVQEGIESMGTKLFEPPILKAR